MRQHYRLAFCAGVGLLALGASGCLPSISDLDSGPLNETFAVSDIFTPSGFMGDGKYFGSLVGYTNQGCKTRSANPRGNCYRFEYYPNTIDEDPWAGVFWVFPANSWGSQYGHAINSERFTQISFRAAVEYDHQAPTGYTVGGLTDKLQGQAGGIDPIGFFSDAAGVPQGKDYRDGIKATVGVPIGTDTGVTAEMKPFQIALTDFTRQYGCVVQSIQEPGKPPLPPIPENCKEIQDPAQPNDPNAKIKVATDLIGGFAWSLHYPTDKVTCKAPPVQDPPLDPATWCHQDRHSSQFVKPKPVTVYIDDIVWEAP